MCGKYGPYIEFPGGEPYRPGIDGPDEAGTSEIQTTEALTTSTEAPRHDGVSQDDRHDRTGGTVSSISEV